MKIMTKEMFAPKAKEILMFHNVSELEEQIKNALYQAHAAGFYSCIEEIRSGDLTIREAVE